MANCSHCNSEVGCACNLVGGLCTSCYAKRQSSPEQFTPLKKSSNRVIYTRPPNNQPPNTEFGEILATKGLSKEEKIKRINDILERKIKEANDTQL